MDKYSQPQRVYSKKHDLMLYPDNKKPGFVDRLGRIHQEPIRVSLEDIYFYQPHQYEPMLLSPAIDSKSNNIYEGDIIDYRLQDGNSTLYRGVVRFGEWLQDGSGGEYASPSCFGFYVEYVRDATTAQYSSLFDQEHASILEVAIIRVKGNIYEYNSLLDVEREEE